MEIVFSEWKKKKTDEAGVKVTLDSGFVVEFPAPILWPVPKNDLEHKNEAGELDPILESADDYAPRVLDVVKGQDGQKAWDQFKAEDGDWDIVNALLVEAKGLNAGE